MSHEVLSKSVIRSRRLGPLKRAQAIERYNEEPNVCAYCRSFIRVRDNEKPTATRKKKFCNSSCSASFSSVHGAKRRDGRFIGPRNANATCSVCGTRFYSRNEGHVLCSRKCISGLPHKNSVRAATKGDLRSRRKGYQSARSSIRNNAAKVFGRSGKPMVCAKCGYGLYVEIAHVRSVSSFPDTALISEINCICNLVALCRNHHWEYDKGLLQFDAEWTGVVPACPHKACT